MARIVLLHDTNIDNGLISIVLGPDILYFDIQNRIGLLLKLQTIER